MPMKRLNEIQRMIKQSPATQIVEYWNQMYENIYPLQSIIAGLEHATSPISQEILNMTHRHQELLNIFPTLDLDISKMSFYPSFSKEFAKTSLDVISIAENYDLPEDIEDSKETVMEIFEQEPTLTWLQICMVISLLLIIVSFIQNNQNDQDSIVLNSTVYKLVEHQNVIMTSILDKKLSEIIQKQQDILSIIKYIDDDTFSNLPREFAKTSLEIINILEDYDLPEDISKSKQTFVILLEQKPTLDLGQAISLVELIETIVTFIMKRYSKQKSASDDPALNKIVEQNDELIKQNSEIIDLLKKQNIN